MIKLVFGAENLEFTKIKLIEQFAIVQYALQIKHHSRKPVKKNGFVINAKNILAEILIKEMHLLYPMVLSRYLKMGHSVKI